jgi:5-oxoprolinase (ATP-hydrolysing)
MVPRATSSSADAYLSPILREYLSSFFLGFDEGLSGSASGGARVEFMTSEGNLVELDKFSGEYHCSSGRSGTHVVYRFEEYLEWTGGGSRRV